MSFLPQPPGILELPMLTLSEPADDPIRYQFDLGSDHWARFTQWCPDFNIVANRERWGHIADIIIANPVCGVIVIHRCKTETGWQEGSIHFKTPATAHWEPNEAAHCWDVHSWIPLHVEPSLLSHCPCNDHGFIREGKWVRA